MLERDIFKWKGLKLRRRQCLRSFFWIIFHCFLVPLEAKTYSGAVSFCRRAAQKSALEGFRVETPKPRPLSRSSGCLLRSSGRFLGNFPRSPPNFREVPLSGSVTFRGIAKGWFPKGRMLPRNENRNEGTFAKTTLLRNRPFISQ